VIIEDFEVLFCREAGDSAAPGPALTLEMMDLLELISGEATVTTCRDSMTLSLDCRFEINE